MSDNVPISAGSGTTISTEEITSLNGGVVSAQHVQRMALAKRTADGTVIDVTSSTAALSNVGASVTSVTLKSANASRIALVIVNESASATLYVKYGTTASTSSYTYKLGVDDILREELYTGRVDGIWDTAVGTARVTELTP